MPHSDRDVTAIFGRTRSGIVSNRSLGVGDRAAKSYNDQINENVKMQLEMQTFYKAPCRTSSVN